MTARNSTRAGSISAQNTFDTDSFLAAIITHHENKIQAIYPNYREYISPSASRRMETGVKIGFVAATKALTLAQLSQPDAILTATGLGCIADTEKFLNSIINNNETYLTPTSFIQSTHNTVGAQIALGLQCNGYNSTYTHGNLSFNRHLYTKEEKIKLEKELDKIFYGIISLLKKGCALFPVEI